MALTKISRSLLDTGISDSSDATAITIDSSENVLVGSGTSNGISGGTTGLQVAGAGFSGIISATRHDNNAYGSGLMLGKSRNTTVGSNTIIQNGDAIGAIGFFADDGTNLDSQVAYITASVDGAPGANDTPGRLTFSTTSDGAASVSERVRIDSNGDFLVRQTSSAVYDTNSGADVRQFWGNQFSGANNTNSKVIIGSATALPLVGGATVNASSKFIVNSYIGFGSADQTAGGEDGYMAFYTSSGGAAGTEKMRITNDGNVGIGVTAPTNTFVVGHASHGVAIDHVSSLPSQAGMFTSSSATTAQAYGDLVVKSRTDYSGYGIGFYTASSGGSPLQRMALIDSGALYLYNQNTGSGNADLRYSTGTGAVTYDTSSRLVKDKIEPIPYGLETVLSLSPKKYIRTDSDNEVEVGFIADEIEKVIPELVGMMEKSNFTDNEEDTELIAGSVDYKKLTAVLTKAIQEQQEQIETLQKEIKELKDGTD